MCDKCPDGELEWVCDEKGVAWPKSELEKFRAKIRLDETILGILKEVQQYVVEKKYTDAEYLILRVRDMIRSQNPSPPRKPRGAGW